MSSAAVSTGYIRHMVKEEKAVCGDEVTALRRIAQKARVSFWTLNNLKIGRAKTINADVRDRIRQTFVDHCRGHAARLLHDAEMAAASGPANDVLEDIQNQIRALSAQLEAAKGQKNEVSE